VGEQRIPINHIAPKIGALSRDEQIALFGHYTEANTLFHGEVEVANKMLAFIESHGLLAEWTAS